MCRQNALSKCSHTWGGGWGLKAIGTVPGLSGDQRTHLSADLQGHPSLLPSLAPQIRLQLPSTSPTKRKASVGAAGRVHSTFKKENWECASL